jgi:hypothetical protein
MVRATTKSGAARGVLAGAVAPKAGTFGATATLQTHPAIGRLVRTSASAPPTQGERAMSTKTSRDDFGASVMLNAGQLETVQRQTLEGLATDMRAAAELIDDLRITAPWEPHLIEDVIASVAHVREGVAIMDELTWPVAAVTA